MIAAEDYAERNSSGGELASGLLRLFPELGFSVCVSNGTQTDLLRANGNRRPRRLRQLCRYQILEPVSIDDEFAAQAGFPAIRTDNDDADLEVLAAFLSGAAGVLVTDDAKLRRRAGSVCDPESVLSLREAVEWLTNLRPSSVELPSVRTVPAHTLRACVLFQTRSDLRKRHLRVLSSGCGRVQAVGLPGHGRCYFRLLCPARGMVDTRLRRGTVVGVVGTAGRWREPNRPHAGTATRDTCRDTSGQPCKQRAATPTVTERLWVGTRKANLDGEQTPRWLRGSGVSFE